MEDKISPRKWPSVLFPFFPWVFGFSFPSSHFRVVWGWCWKGGAVYLPSSTCNGLTHSLWRWLWRGLEKPSQSSSDVRGGLFCTWLPPLQNGGTRRKSIQKVWQTRDRVEERACPPSSVEDKGTLRDVRRRLCSVPPVRAFQDPVECEELIVTYIKHSTC